jgi:hypothetical protein
MPDVLCERCRTAPPEFFAHVAYDTDAGVSILWDTPLCLDCKESLENLGYRVLTYDQPYGDD